MKTEDVGQSVIEQEIECLSPSSDGMVLHIRRMVCNTNKDGVNGRAPFFFTSIIPRHLATPNRIKTMEMEERFFELKMKVSFNRELKPGKIEIAIGDEIKY
jgi:hypothetical protein